MESLAVGEPGGRVGGQEAPLGSRCSWKLLQVPLLQVQLLPNQTQVSLPDTQQSQSTDARGGEGMHRVYGRASAKQGERAARALKTRIPRWLSGRGF